MMKQRDARLRRITKGSWKRFLASGLLLLAVVAMAAVINVPKQAAHAVSGDWTTFQADNARSGYNPLESAINATTASSLQLQRTYQTGGNVVTQPVVVGGQVFWGSWDGNEYSTDLNGNLLWSTNISARVPDCSGSQFLFGVGSTPTIADETINGTLTEVAYVNGRDPTLNAAALYALNAATGGVIWETPLTTEAGSFGWSSPAFYKGKIYLGLSSVDDCPLVRAAELQIDPVSGSILHTFYTVPSGCVGGSIWSSSAIDEATGIVYITTGNSSFTPCSTKELYAQAIIALNASDLSYISSWQVPPKQRTGDSDFGATPTLFQATIGSVTHQMIGVENKNGIYYALDRSNLAAGPLWMASIGTSGHDITPSAWDGTRLYVGSNKTTINGVACAGSLRALDPSSGNFIWQQCFTDARGAVYAAVSAVPGVVFVGEGTHFDAINSATGSILFSYQVSGIVQGAASISNGVVYVGNNSGALEVFSLPGFITPTPTPGASIGQDTFQRPNQTFWGKASDGQYWGGSANSSAIYSIANDTGQIAPTAPYPANYAMLLGPAASNADVLVTGVISSFSNANLGLTLHWQDANDYYKVEINGSQLVLDKRVNGSLVTLASTSFAATAGIAYSIRSESVGTTLSARVWLASQPEPQNWMVSATDTTFSSGFCGMEIRMLKGVTANLSAFQATSL